MMGLRAKVRRPGGSLVGKIVEVDEASVSLEDEKGEVHRLPLEGIQANLAEWPSEHR
jgi:hypothetical protein